MARNFRVVGLAIFGSGFILSVIGIETEIILFRVGAGVYLLGIVVFYLAVYSIRKQKHLSGSGRHSSGQGFPVPLGGRGDPVAEYVSRRPLLQAIWFLFVAIVLITMGIVAEFHSTIKDNLILGIFVIIIGLGSLMASLLAFVRWRDRSST